MTISLVTGGSGFIGSNLVRFLLSKNHKVVSIDKKTYASNKLNINNKNYKEFKLDIKNQKKLTAILKKIKPSTVFHLAAETHVDNSISSPKVFIDTNILGTYSILQAIRSLNEIGIKIKLIHVSTDEVYGDLVDLKKINSSESDRYYPSSPYSSSKASSDHLVTAWTRTYGLNTVITNCSNNFGPYQHKEKFIPTIINCIKYKKPIPIYGDGRQEREWLYVKDHCKALFMISKNFKSSEHYNIGSKNLYKNINLVNKICKIYDINFGTKNFRSSSLIKHVPDRKGHDKKYSLNIKKIKKEIKWEPSGKIDKNILKTIEWYLK
tara:strand:+ start:578 stop:1543 length:966 start_codon:yes stop_codon:yes gene_type:complete